jgi:hypothetical protein
MTPTLFLLIVVGLIVLLIKKKTTAGKNTPKGLIIEMGSKQVNNTSLTLDEYIEQRLSEGLTKDEIQKELLGDLKSGGPIFSEFRRAIKSTARGSINRVRDVGYFSEDGLDRGYKWSAIMLEDTCEDCRKRNGQVKTWEEWETIGPPRTGTTACMENCRCVLIPADIAQKNS